MSGADLLFRAFADQTRLRILNLLGRGEVCVRDLMRILRSPQPKVSRHLSYLKRAGLVMDRRQGPWRHYSLAPARSTVHQRLLGCVGGCLEELPDLRRDARRLSALKRRRRR